MLCVMSPRSRVSCTVAGKTEGEDCSGTRVTSPRRRSYVAPVPNPARDMAELFVGARRKTRSTWVGWWVGDSVQPRGWIQPAKRPIGWPQATAPGRMGNKHGLFLMLIGFRVRPDIGIICRCRLRFENNKPWWQRRGCSRMQLVMDNCATEVAAGIIPLSVMEQGLLAAGCSRSGALPARRRRPQGHQVWAG